MADDDQPPLILVDDRQSQPLDVDGLVRLARACLIGEGAGNSELSVSLVTEEEMAGLHERYMDEAGPTDVLSFPLDGRDELPAGEPRALGDVVLCPEVVGARWREPLVHGLLHLLGYDHGEEMAERERAHAAS